MGLKITDKIGEHTELEERIVRKHKAIETLSRMMPSISRGIKTSVYRKII